MKRASWHAVLFLSPLKECITSLHRSCSTALSTRTFHLQCTKNTWSIILFQSVDNLSGTSARTFNLGVPAEWLWTRSSELKKAFSPSHTPSVILVHLDTGGLFSSERLKAIPPSVSLLRFICAPRPRAVPSTLSFIGRHLWNKSRALPLRCTHTHKHTALTGRNMHKGVEREGKEDKRPSDPVNCGTAEWLARSHAG